MGCVQHPKQKCKVCVQCSKYTAEVVCVKVKVLWLSHMMRERLRELLIIQTGYIEVSDSILLPKILLPLVTKLLDVLVEGIKLRVSREVD